MRINLYNIFDHIDYNLKALSINIDTEKVPSNICDYDLIKITCNKKTINSDLNKDKFFHEFQHNNGIILLNKSLLDKGGTVSEIQNKVKRIHHIKKNTKFLILTIDPINLFNGERFDISYKVLFAKFYLQNNSRNDFYRNLYHEHLIRITGPGYEIKERDGSGKEGIENYIKSFQEFLNSDGYNFSSIPVGNNLTLFDGAHRTAASIVKGKPIDINFINHPAKRLGYEYLIKNPFNHKPVPQDLNKIAAIEFIKRNQLCRCFVIYPTVSNKNTAINYIKENYNIIFKLNEKLEDVAQKELMRILYRNNEYLSNDEKKTNKQKNCFPSKGEACFIFVNLNLTKRTDQIKSLIRDHYKIGNHSIHSTDNYDETLSLANFILSPNFHYVNKIKRSTNDSLLTEFYNFSKTKQLREDYVITGSFLLSFFCDRIPNDIDFISTKDMKTDCFTSIGCHNNCFVDFKITKNELIYNPQNHFYYKGFKFISPEILLHFKKNRGEAKDKVDISILKELTSSKDSNFLIFLLLIPINKIMTTFQKIRFKLKKNKKIVSIYLKLKSMVTK